MTYLGLFWCVFFYGILISDAHFSIKGFYTSPSHLNVEFILQRQYQVHTYALFMNHSIWFVLSRICWQEWTFRSAHPALDVSFNQAFVPNVDYLLISSNKPEPEYHIAREKGYF